MPRSDISGRLSVVFGLPEPEAAGSVGIGTKKFRQMVADGRMPLPRRIDCNIVWDVDELRDAFKALPYDDLRVQVEPAAVEPVSDAGGADGWEDVL